MTPHTNAVRPRTGPPRFPLVRLSEITAPTAPMWAIKGILPSAGLAVIYGPPGCGKSFLALHVALSIAAGSTFAGRKVRPGGVVYVAAEAGDGMRRRIVAARNAMGLGGDVPFALLAAAPNLGIGDSDAATLISDVREQTRAWGWAPAVVVVDTLARVTPGMDENMSRDMGTFVGNADRLARDLGCLIVAVHHCGKVEESGMRGSTALHGAADAEWAISAGRGVRTVRLVKNKEGEDGLSWSFRLETIELGRDEDGDPITTCVVEDVTEPTAGTQGGTRGTKTNAPMSMRLLLGAFETALLEHGETVRPYPDGPMVQAVRRDTVRAEFMGRHPAEEHDARKRAFNRGLAGAVEKALLVSGEVRGASYVWR